jgi:hypothetical protein
LLRRGWLRAKERMRAELAQLEAERAAQAGGGAQEGGCARGRRAEVAAALADGAAAVKAAAAAGRVDRRTAKALAAAMDHILRQLRFLGLV